MEQGQEEFEEISKQIRKEVAAFEKRRVKDFKHTIIKYLELLMNNQIQVPNIFSLQLNFSGLQLFEDRCYLLLKGDV